MPDKVIPDSTNSSITGTTLRRWAEVRPGEYAPEVKAISAAASVGTLWTASGLLAANGSTVSDWIDVAQLENLLIIRKSTGGTYALEIDWSRGGVSVDFTEVVATTPSVPLVKPVASQFARLRVRNTDAVTAFSAHLTVVNAR